MKLTRQIKKEYINAKLENKELEIKLLKQIKEENHKLYDCGARKDDDTMTAVIYNEILKREKMCKRLDMALEESKRKKTSFSQIGYHRYLCAEVSTAKENIEKELKILTSYLPKKENLDTITQKVYSDIQFKAYSLIYEQAVSHHNSYEPFSVTKRIKRMNQYLGYAESNPVTIDNSYFKGYQKVK